MHTSIKNSKAMKLFDESVLSTVKHNVKLRREILSSLKPINLVSGKILTGRAYQGLWDSKSHDAVIERTIRGLYYKHFQDIIGKRAIIKVQWLREINENVINIVGGYGKVGDGEFQYRFARSLKNPLLSIWIFLFYNSHFSSGYSIPIK